MASDQVEILGRWLVSFQKWKWEYVFSADGTVTWRDPQNNDGGAGRWSLTAATVYITWNRSTTKDIWNRPIHRQGQTGAIDASYGKGPFTAEKLPETVLPAMQGSADEVEMELDPQTGQFTYGHPSRHPKYIDRVFTAVAYGIVETQGYLVYCNGLELPILVRESMVDFTLAQADTESSKIYDDFASAQAAAADSPGRRRVAYFWGAGGAVISPTVIGPATTPELYSTLVAVRDLRDLWVSIMLPALTMAIGMIEGPKPMSVNTNSRVGRTVRRRGGNVPARGNPPPPRPAAAPKKVAPVNGQVSVGGGFENPNGSNLNPVKAGSGGPSKGIPNHVPGAMEDMGELFEPGSVKRMISSRLRFGDVDWAKGTQAAAKVMSPGGKVSMNVWCQGATEQAALRQAFETAGFKNVKTVGDGVGTMLFADF